jgi:hypothetical protein
MSVPDDVAARNIKRVIAGLEKEIDREKNDFERQKLLKEIAMWEVKLKQLQKAA